LFILKPAHQRLQRFNRRYLNIARSMLLKNIFKTGSFSASC
jgi:hypothetical protein